MLRFEAADGIASLLESGAAAFNQTRDLLRHPAGGAVRIDNGLQLHMLRHSTGHHCRYGDAAFTARRDGVAVDLILPERKRAPGVVDELNHKPGQWLRSHVTHEEHRAAGSRLGPQFRQRRLRCEGERSDEHGSHAHGVLSAIHSLTEYSMRSPLLLCLAAASCLTA